MFFGRSARKVNYPNEPDESRGGSATGVFKPQGEDNRRGRRRSTVGQIKHNMADKAQHVAKVVGANGVW